MYSQPLRFEPYLRPLVWGGRSLGAVLGKLLPTEDNYGESWEVSDHPLHRSRLVGDSRTLRDLMVENAPGLLGPDRKDATFPWLIKFLDARDWLSVQVHPDDDNVATLWPGECGKTEAWFVLAATPASKIFAGLRPGVGPREFRAALENGTVADLLHAFTPRPGDCVYLPAGTVHAVGGGVLLAEIQQTSDATFRLFDWNRVDAAGKSRPLHIDQGLAAITWPQEPVEPAHVDDFTQPGVGNSAQMLVRCRYFQLTFLRQQRVFPLGDVGRLQALLVLAGQVAWPGHSAGPGQALVLPAAMPTVHFTPDPFVTALLATLP